ncbi:MAG: CvpA family protein [Clostridia bacterium]
MNSLLLFEEVSTSTAGKLGPFTYLEVVVGVILLLAIFKGATKGLTGQIFKLISLGGGIALGCMFFKQVGGAIGKLVPIVAEKIGETIAQYVWWVVGFLAIWIAVSIVVFILEKLIVGKQSKKAGAINRLLGVVLALAKWYVILCVLFALLTLIPSPEESSFLYKALEFIDTQINGGAFIKYIANENANFIGKWVLSLFSAT